MAIHSQFNKTVSTKRLTAVVGTYKEEWADNIVSLLCAMHPVSSELTSVGGGMFATHKLYCAVDADVQIGDRVYSNAEPYTVIGVDEYNFGRCAGNQHLRVMLKKGI